MYSLSYCIPLIQLPKISNVVTCAMGTNLQSMNVVTVKDCTYSWVGFLILISKCTYALMHFSAFFQSIVGDGAGRCGSEVYKVVAALNFWMEWEYPCTCTLYSYVCVYIYVNYLQLWFYVVLQTSGFTYVPIHTKFIQLSYIEILNETTFSHFGKCCCI